MRQSAMRMAAYLFIKLRGENMMSLITDWRRNGRLLALALITPFMLPQTAHAKFVYVTWDTALYNNIRCIKIVQNDFKGDLSARDFRVNPANGKLSTTYSVPDKGDASFVVGIFDAYPCRNKWNGSAKKASTFSVSNSLYKYNTALGKKYIYVYFLKK